MGININTAQFLLGVRRAGAAFERTLTVGRLHLNVYKPHLRRLFHDEGLLDEAILAEVPDSGAQPYAEPFLRMLGAKTVEAMDVSDYEGATRLQDLNTPIPSSLVEAYDLVCDGGTLEHVLHFTTALHNCMSMVKRGGSLVLHLPVNNCMGHGFYQLSPDLFFRVLSPPNGFEVKRMVIHAVGPYNRWYEVADPHDVHGRVELISWRPMHLLVHAVKTGPTPATLTTSQQTSYEGQDYQRIQAADAACARSEAAAAQRTWINRLPGLAQFLRVARNGIQFYARQSLCNRRYYRPVSKT